MTAAIYARVSTDDQRCDMQLTELRGYASRMGWQLIEYIDQGVSGTRRNRPALDRLFADARLRKFDVVLVWKLDRFGRSLKGLIENINTLDSLGIRFLAPTQMIDTGKDSPMGRFILHLFGALAEFERALIVERVRAGVAEARRQGKSLGRPKRDYDLSKVKKLRAQGVSWRAISKKLKVPVSTLREGVREAGK